MAVCDCHTHSTNSFDAVSSPDAMALRAHELGLSVYALTEHCELDRWFTREHYGNDRVCYPEDTFDFARSFECAMNDNMRLKDKYSGRMTFLSGIELAQAHLEPGLAAAVSADSRLDFVLGSVHRIREYDDFAFIKYSENDPHMLLEQYFNEVLELARLDVFDSLAHLTYPLRYIEGEQRINADMTRFEDIVREIFRTLAESGKALEINTSGLRKSYGKTFPDFAYIKMFRECGGEMVTVGSDAHCTEDIAAGIDGGINTAKAAGFDRVVYFVGRKPVFVNI